MTATSIEIGRELTDLVADRGLDAFYHPFAYAALRRAVQRS